MSRREKAMGLLILLMLVMIGVGVALPGPCGSYVCSFGILGILLLFVIAIGGSGE